MTPPPRGAGWNPENISTRTSILRAKRVMLELLWCCVVVVEAFASLSRSSKALPQWNRGLPANWVLKPPDDRSTCVENKASQSL